MREAARRMRVAFAHGRERAALERFSSERVRLTRPYSTLSSVALLDYFRFRAPRFFSGFENRDATARLQQVLFAAETEQLFDSAIKLLASAASLQGINWRRDPVSNRIWPLDYHADIRLRDHDGSDIRALWEVNRLNHFLTLSRAYVVSGDEKYVSSLLTQFDSWLEHNPLGRGPNWNCAMEVSLRAMNLLAAFTSCNKAQCFTEDHLERWLQAFQQHGAHIMRNLEFSHLGTTNHYLTNVVGLLWLGVVLPELTVAAEWRDWSLKQLLFELDAQVLPDGADYEGATGYHRYVLELVLYSFILCRHHKIEIESRYWKKLEAMLDFVQSYVRPDGGAPLIGDCDDSQVMPIRLRNADDHNYLISIGAIATGEARFKIGPVTEEILWLLGEIGINDFSVLPAANPINKSRAFVHAGIYVLRKDDLYLLFNAARHLRAGRSSHRHNDALSVEVSACGRAFIIDPGTYVYSADLAARHAFRSTAYHSTIQVDNAEQNSIEESKPFLFGNEAKPFVTSWETSASLDSVTGVHLGYERLRGGVRHQRSITFYKDDRWWLIEDWLTGSGTHEVTVRFHLADGLDIDVAKGNVIALDQASGARLVIIAFDFEHEPVLESQFVSRKYGSRVPLTTATWISKVDLPCTLRWALLPICASEDEQTRRLAVAHDLAKRVI
jgi:hypothetical protein